MLKSHKVLVTILLTINSVVARIRPPAISPANEPSPDTHAQHHSFASDEYGRSQNDYDQASHGYRQFYQRSPYYDSSYFAELSFAKGVSQNSDFDSIIQKLSATARVVSALSLQNGLSDGSIPVDDVIAELLNILSVDLKGLVAFDKKKVDDFVEKIYSVPLDDTSEPLEKHFKSVFMIRKIWSEIGGEKVLEGLPEEPTYKELASLGSVDVAPLTSIPLDVLITQLSTFSTLNDQGIGNLKSELSKFLNAINTLATSFNFPKFIGILDRLKPLGPLARIADLYDNLGRFYVAVHDDQINSVASNFNNLEAFSSNSDSGSSANTIRSIINSRLFHNSLIRLYTTGFVNGLHDLGNLKDDVMSQWLLNQVNPSIDIKGLRQFDQLEAPMKELDEKWTKASSEKVYNRAKRLANAQNLLHAQTKTGVTLENLKSEIPSIQNCQTATVVTDIFKKWQRVFNGAGILGRKISTLNMIHSTASQMKESISGLSKSTSSGNVQRLLQFLQGIKPQLDIVTSGPAFKDVVVSIDVSNGMFITNIKTNDFTKSYIGSFNKLVELESEFDEVAQAAMASIEIRELKKAGDVSKEMKEVSLAFSESSASLASIRKLLESWKGDGKSGSKQLAGNLKDLPKLSRSFGEAVNALVMVKKASEKTAEFETFVETGQSVRSGVSAGGDVPFEKEFSELWGDFDGTVTRIMSMLTVVDDWIGRKKLAENSKLSDYASIFTEFTKFDDVDLETDNRMDAVDRFEKRSFAAALKKDVPEFKKSLLALSKLDLKFSRFQSSIHQMPDTLKQLSAVLGSNPLQKSTVPPVMATKTESDSKAGLVPIIFGCVMLVILLCCVVAYIFVFIKRKEEKYKSWWNFMTCGCCCKKKNDEEPVIPVAPEPLPPANQPVAEVVPDEVDAQGIDNGSAEGPGFNESAGNAENAGLVKVAVAANGAPRASRPREVKKTVNSKRTQSSHSLRTCQLANVPPLPREDNGGPEPSYFEQQAKTYTQPTKFRQNRAHSVCPTLGKADTMEDVPSCFSDRGPKRSASTVPEPDPETKPPRTESAPAPKQRGDSKRVSVKPASSKIIIPKRSPSAPFPVDPPKRVPTKRYLPKPVPAPPKRDPSAPKLTEPDELYKDRMKPTKPQ